MMKIALRNKKRCMIVLLVVLLVQPERCTSLHLRDSTGMIDGTSRKLKESDANSNQDRYNRALAMNVLANQRAAARRSQGGLRCRTECKCLRRRRCGSKRTAEKRKQCRQDCKKKAESENVLGRTFSSDVPVFHSLPDEPFQLALKAFNPESIVTAYSQCSDLLMDIEAAAGLVANAVIRQEAKSQEQYPQPPEREPDSTGSGAEPDINEDSYDTNTQEEDIDEADIVKSDGTNVYASYGDEILVWDAQSGEHKSRTKMPASPTSSWSQPRIRGLLLYESYLVAVVEGYTNYYLYEQDPPTIPILSDSGSTQVRVYDVSSGAIPTDGTSPLTLLGTESLTGRFVAGRSIDNIVHVVTMSYVDTWSHLTQRLYRYDERYEGMSDDEYTKAATSYAVEDIKNFAALLVDEIAPEAGVDCSNVAEITVFASGDDEANATNSSRPDLFGTEGILKGFLGIRSFDLLTDIQPDGAIAMNTASSFFDAYDATVYSSKDVLVAAGGGWWSNWSTQAWYQSTYLMSFKLDPSGGPAIGWGTGQVPGSVKDQFSMDEYNSYLRVASTTNEQWACVDNNGGESNSISRGFWCDWQLVANSTSQLTILALPGSVNEPIKEVSRIDNLGITEEIKSVRFFDDKAFIVTFQRTDPLYAINLSDPLNPDLVGELKIPGFSRYMHPYPDLGDGRMLMIGIGQDANEESGLELGFQVSLFDLTDMSNPELLQRYNFEDYTRSDAEFDHYGFRFLEESKILIIPLSSWSGEKPFDGFAVVNVTTDVIAHLFDVSMAEPDAISNRCYSCESMPSRSLVFQGDATFIKGHSYKSVDLSNSVVKGSEVVRWSNTLDPPNISETNCCPYWGPMAFEPAVGVRVSEDHVP